MEQGGVEKDLEGGEGLAAPLRSETEQEHVAVAVLHVERRSVALQVLLTEKVAGNERRALRRVFGERDALEVLGHRENGAAADEDLGLLLHPRHHGVIRIDLQLEDRARQEELVAGQVLGRVLDREVELVDGEHAAVVQTNEGSTFAHECVHDPHALAADTAGVAGGHRALSAALDEGVGAEVREDDDVEALVQIAGLHVGGSHRDRLEAIHLEHPAGPTLVHVAAPGPVEADARAR